MTRRVALSAFGLAAVCAVCGILYFAALLETTTSARGQDEEGVLIREVEEPEKAAEIPGVGDCAGKHVYHGDVVMTLQISSRPSKPKEEEEGAKQAQVKAATAYQANDMETPREKAKQESAFLNARCDKLACNALRCTQTEKVKKLGKCACVRQECDSVITSPAPSWYDFTCFETKEQAGTLGDVVWNCEVRYSYKHACWCQQEEKP